MGNKYRASIGSKLKRKKSLRENLSKARAKRLPKKLNNSTPTIQPGHSSIEGLNYVNEQIKTVELPTTNSLTICGAEGKTNFVIEVEYFDYDKKKNNFVLPVEEAIKRISAQTGYNESTMIQIKRKAEELMQNETIAHYMNSIESDDQQLQASSSTSCEGFNQPKQYKETEMLETVEIEYEEDEVIIKEEIEDTELNIENISYETWPNETNSTPVTCPNKDPLKTEAHQSHSPTRTL